MAENLLSDEQMKNFIVNGFVTVPTSLSLEFHEEIFNKTATVFDKEGNPGNNLLPRIPEIQCVFDDPYVKGALTSLLGPDSICNLIVIHITIHPVVKGRICTKTVVNGGRIIPVGCWFSYYPQDTPVERGPTGVVPISHYFSTQEGSQISPETPISGKAGTVAFANYDLWHRAMPNQTEHRRYMMKFYMPG